VVAALSAVSQPGFQGEDRKQESKGAEADGGGDQRVQGKAAKVARFSHTAGIAQA